MIFLNDTLADDDASPYQVWPIRDIVWANIQEILSGQTFTEVQNLHCDHDLEYNKATFSQDTPEHEHALSN